MATLAPPTFLVKVLSLTKFTGISKDGKQKETQNTFIQRTTSVDSIYKLDTSDLDDVAILTFTMWINKFEFSSIEEVDPVDAWTIIGAIGGVWQFVVVGFGLFFVFAEKQAPEFKLRNFIKTARKPITSARRWSTISARTSSIQDTIVEAADEDLPTGWVKRQRSNGSMYYHNTIMGMVQDDPPRDFLLDFPAPSAGSRAAYQGEACCDSLPAGWIERTDDNGRKYYVNTHRKCTQWERPSQRAAIPSGGRGTVVEVDAPRMTCHNGSGTNTSNAIHNAVPRTNSLWPRVSSGVRNVSRVERGIPTAGDAELPTNWHKRETSDGKIYYANCLTKKTQWERPTR